ncbi:transposase [Streptomyces sp. NPDC056982]|uniref:transposase n=1 Tax=Streptomyces sp. NPDC056982 TaxID=3345986 RepID=UPI00363C26CD
MRRAQLTDVEREFIEPYLPIGEYGSYRVRLRQQFEGVMWRFRTGGQWREIPAEFGAGQLTRPVDGRVLGPVGIGSLASGARP